MLDEADCPLRRALEELAPPVAADGVWAHVQRAVAERRQRRRRRALMAGAAVVVLACLGFAAFAAVHWWPHQDEVLLVDDGTMGGATGQPAQPGGSTGLWERLTLPPTTDLVCYSLAMDPADPSVLYAATEQGLLLTTDGAATWSRQWVGRYVHSVAIDPNVPSTVYVTAPDGTGHMRLYRSPDRGADWTQISWPEEEFGEFEGPLWIDVSSEPSVLYAPTSSRQGIYKSTDGGATWEVAFQPSAETTDVEIVAVAGSTLYAQLHTVDGTEFIRSADAGETWLPVQTPAGYSDPSTPPYLRGDPADPGRVFLYGRSTEIFQDTGSPALRVFASSDGAQTWAELAGEERVWAEAVAAAAPGTPAAAIRGAAGFLAAFIESETPLIEATGVMPFAGFAGASGFVIDPRDALVLYVPTDHGIYRSTDRVTWTNTTAAITTDPYVNQVVVDPLAPSTLYAATPQSLLKSTDAGDSWTPILQATPTWSVALAPSSTSTLYACTGQGLLRTDNGGADWVVVVGIDHPADGLMLPPPGGLLVSSGSPLTVLSYTSDGIYRSADGGDNWLKGAGLPEMSTVDALQILTDSDAPLLIQGAGDPSTIFTVVATRSDGYRLSVQRSKDGGTTWSEFAGLDADEGRVYLPLAIGPGDPLAIYAHKALVSFYGDGGIGYSSDDVVWRSLDGGVSWKPTEREGLDDDLNDLSPGPGDGALYTVAELFDAGSSEVRQAIYRTTDQGDSWVKLCDGPDLPAWALNDPNGSGFIQALEIAPSGVLYARTDRAIYRWTPGGAGASQSPAESSTSVTSAGAAHTSTTVTSAGPPTTPIAPVLEDGTWQLTVDRRASSTSELPSSWLSELLADTVYLPIDAGDTYQITVADDGSALTIEGLAKALGGEQRSVSAARTSTTDGYAWYELTYFSGGRFVVWETLEGLQAELTLYGSGLPIIYSVRGAFTKSP